MKQQDQFKLQVQVFPEIRSPIFLAYSRFIVTLSTSLVQSHDSQTVFGSIKMAQSVDHH